MTLDEITIGMKCLAGVIMGTKSECMLCYKKPLCDDFTRVILRHKDTEKKKTAAEIQLDLLRDTTKKYPAF